MLRLMIALSVAVPLCLASLWWLGRPASPDAFYDPPRGEKLAPGRLLRVEEFSRDVPPHARAWRILYATTRADASPAVASALVVTPQKAVATANPIIAWAHGTTGVARGCAPSLMKHPFLNVPALGPLIENGWALVATDYVGLGTDGGHAYLVGEDAARAVLDSVRAANQMKDATLETRYVVWGHSQGGNSALWTGARAGDYAPELKALGVAALAPASDMAKLAQSTQATTFGKIVNSLLISAYAGYYPDIDMPSYVDGRSAILVRDIASRCVGDFGTFPSLASALVAPAAGIFSRDPMGGALGRRLGENTPTGAIPAPLLIAQGLADDLIGPSIQDSYVAARCAAGQAVDYRRYAGRDHMSLIADDSAAARDLLEWTRDRFAGLPAESRC